MRVPGGCILTADAARGGRTDLAERLRARSLAVGTVTGLIVFAGLYPILGDAPTLSRGLLDRALPVLVVAALAGAVALAEIYRRRYRVARISAVAAVAVVVTGWGVGQYPWMLVDQLTIDDAAGAHATLTGLLVVCAGRGAHRARFRIPAVAHPDREVAPNVICVVQRYR